MSDEIVWQVINHGFCTYKLKTPNSQSFCRNEYNVTGLCNRQSCPLANSRYATVRYDAATGKLYLYMKTVERASFPNRLWERVLLSRNKEQALEQIRQKLLHWPYFLNEKCKLRLERLMQVRITTARVERRAQLLGEKLIPVLAPKVRRKEETRERKALSAAKVEKQIEKELLERLRSGVYGEHPLNVDEKLWSKVMKNMEKQGGMRDQDQDEVEREEEEDLELEADEEMVGNVEYVSDDELETENDADDLEDWLEGNSGASDFDAEEFPDADSDEDSDEEKGNEKGNRKEDKDQKPTAHASKKRKRGVSKKIIDPKSKKRGPRVEIEYELEGPVAIPQLA